MQTIQQTYYQVYSPVAKKQSFVSKFIAWSEGQETHRFGWAAAIIAIHACVLAPITVLSIALGGNNFVLWSIALGAIAMALISNLAAMPPKITIPVFFFSILLDIVVIVASLASLL